MDVNGLPLASFFIPSISTLGPWLSQGWQAFAYLWYEVPWWSIVQCPSAGTPPPSPVSSHRGAVWRVFFDPLWPHAVSHAPGLPSSGPWSHPWWCEDSGPVDACPGLSWLQFFGCCVDSHYLPDSPNPHFANHLETCGFCSWSWLVLGNLNVAIILIRILRPGHCPRLFS